MTDSAQRARYAVVGNPVAHSLSPTIHARFAEQTGQVLSYRAIEIDRDRFVEGIRDLQQQGYSGLNVTLPFKREAWTLCDRLEPRAEDAGAVNTLCFEPDGAIIGDNTDGVGLSRDLLNNLDLKLTGAKILILGAGGAVRGVLGPLLELAPSKITLANRTLSRAIELAESFNAQGEIEALGFDALAGQPFDLVINGTAAGLDDEVPPIDAGLLTADTVCYDMMYRLDTATAFVAWARSHSVKRAYDGLGMLVEQAAAAFQIWRGVNPDSAEVIAALRRG